MPDNLEKRDIPGLPEGSHPFLEFSPEQRSLLISTLTSLGHALRKTGVSPKQISDAMLVFYDAPVLATRKNLRSKNVEKEFRYLVETAKVDPIDITKMRLMVEQSLGGVFGLNPPVNDEDQYPSPPKSNATPTTE